MRLLQVCIMLVHTALDGLPCVLVKITSKTLFLFLKF